MRALSRFRRGNEALAPFYGLCSRQQVKRTFPPHLVCTAKKLTADVRINGMWRGSNTETGREFAGSANRAFPTFALGEVAHLPCHGGYSARSSQRIQSCALAEEKTIHRAGNPCDRCFSFCLLVADPFTLALKPHDFTAELLKNCIGKGNTCEDSLRFGQDRGRSKVLQNVLSALGPERVRRTRACVECVGSPRQAKKMHNAAGTAREE